MFNISNSGSIKFNPTDLPACGKFLTSVFILFILTAAGNNFIYAADITSENYNISFQNRLLTVSAEGADLKKVLTDIAENFNFSIGLPASLDKKITININETSLREGLERLLKDLNYSITYSGSKKENRISGVHILEQNGSRTSGIPVTARTSRSNTSSRRIADRISTYERRIEAMKENISRVGVNSTRTRSYQNRIKSYERTIERLKNQLNQ